MASDVVVTAYRVGYLGACPAISTASGLAMVQKALQELYLGKATKFGVSRDEVQKPRTLEITSFGLAVKYEEMRTKTGNIVEVTEMLSPFTTIMLWAALRFCVKKVGKHRKKKLEFAFLPLICTDLNLENSMFSPLDSKYNFVTKVKHPAIFTCVLRHPDAPRVMECHAFVCRNHSDALEIAWNLHEALMQYTKIRRLTRNPTDTLGSSSRHSVIPLVSPTGRIQRVEDPIRSSLSSKKSTAVKKHKNTVVFADICTESSGRGSASSETESSDEYGRHDNGPSVSHQKGSYHFAMEQSRRDNRKSGDFYRKIDSSVKKTRAEGTLRKAGSCNSLNESSPSGSDVPNTNLNWHNRNKIFGGVRVLPPGKPPPRPESPEEPEVIPQAPYSESSSSNISSHRYERKPTSRHKQNMSTISRSPNTSRRSASMHELTEIDLGPLVCDRLDLPAENLTKRIYKEKKTIEETKTTKKGNKAKETKFPMIKLKKWRQRDSSLDRESDSRETESALSGSHLSRYNHKQIDREFEKSHRQFSRKDGVYKDGDSWKKYYWKDNRDLDLEKTMCAPDWDVRKFSDKLPDSKYVNPHIRWSRANLESSLGYIP